MIKFIYILFFSSLLSAQNIPVNVYFIADTTEHKSSSTSIATPKNGWKEFCDKIKYPIEAYNNNIEISFDLGIKIDSSGNVKNINSFGENDRIEFVNSIKRVIYSTKWIPAISNGKNIESNLTIPILYYIKRFDNPFPLVIEGSQVSIQHTAINISSDGGINFIKKIDTLAKEQDSIYYFFNKSRYCNDYSTPYPSIGFDTLTMFVNNHFFQRSGVSTSKLIKLYISESGVIDSVYYTNYFRAFVDDFIIKLQSIKWSPANKNGINVMSSLSLPIVFYLKKQISVFPIIVEAIKCGAL